MDIYYEEGNTSVPVTVVRLVGDVDAACYREVIKAGQKVFNSGARNLLLDLSEVSFMSSSGLIALHSLALIMRGERYPNLDQDHHAMHSVADTVEENTGFERHFKLLNPTLRVRQILEKTGFDHTFEIFTDREAALAAFS
jgi:anti-anti-sigma regulatory factor